MGVMESITTTISNMGKLDNPVECAKLKSEVESLNCSGWKDNNKLKVGGMGLVTGLFGGPVGVGLEAADLAFLFNVCGRACYGIGLIKKREVAFEQDFPLILTIWCGEGRAVNTVSAVAGKVCLKVSGKTAIKVVVGMTAKTVAPAVFTSVILKTIAPMAASKIAGKVAGKLGARWIPILGGAVSAGVNIWVLDGLMSAAEEYYGKEYVEVVNPQLSQLLANV